jgi:NAD(P)-dependent dehydrogenase (short-subunit alcohol dehydrogenase family)
MASPRRKYEKKINLKGQVIIVTGSNTGIGYETVKQLSHT